VKRRDLLVSMAAALGSGALAGVGFAAKGNQHLHEKGENSLISHHLKIQTASYLLREKPTHGLISLSPDGPPPVLYGRQGKPMALNVTNTLDEYTTIHWHGIRLPNEMDGVPYLTQLPLAQGDSFQYKFTPPDAGTHWYHPHCMTMTQIARGLTGVMVIKESIDPGFNDDQVINLRDFKLDKQDALRTPYTLRGAARSGTHGNVLTANWRQAPVYDHPTGGLVRLRLANTDTTRIYKLYLSSAKGEIIAWDGHPIEQSVPMPDENQLLILGPGQRVDIALKMPASEWQTISIFARKSGADRVMASLRAKGPNLKRTLAELKPLKPNPVSQPNLKQAKIHEFVFGWSPDGLAPNNGFCGTLGKTFWSINRKPWPGDNAKGTGPLATLEFGKSYILRLRNESPNLHPIHLHGLAFKPLRSNKRKLAANWTDTMLLLKDEIIDVALVADNRGDWAFHCHVIEHQKTGLAGFIRVA